MEILSLENLFLIVLALVWIFGAVLQDLRRREVDNIWNFYLIAIAIGYRLIVSVFNNNYWFVLNGILGLAIFLFIGNLFYYSRLFAGGDAKLVIALGSVLPLSYNWAINFKISGLFILLFLIFGSLYALVWSFVLMSYNFDEFKKEFIKQSRIYKKLYLISVVFAVVLFVVLILFYFSLSLNKILFSFPILVLLFPVLFVFAKSIEETCLVKKIDKRELTEGDWLYKDIVVNGRKIKANWEGVSAEELRLIRQKYKGKIFVKYGIPFTPSFFFAFIALLFLIWENIFDMQISNINKDKFERGENQISKFKQQKLINKLSIINNFMSKES